MKLPGTVIKFCIKYIPQFSQFTSSFSKLTSNQTELKLINNISNKKILLNAHYLGLAFSIFYNYQYQYMFIKAI